VVEGWLLVAHQDGTNYARSVNCTIRHLLLAPASQSHTLSRRLLLLLRYEGKDPNRHRLLLKARAQLGVLAH